MYGQELLVYAMDDAGLHFDLGLAVLRHGGYEDGVEGALESFTTSARLAPSWEAAHMRSVCLEELGRVPEALAAAEEAVRLLATPPDEAAAEPGDAGSPARHPTGRSATAADADEVRRRVAALRARLAGSVRTATPTTPATLGITERQTPSRSPLAVRLIAGDAPAVCKPAFNSTLENRVYQILLGRYPMHLVLPNVALQTIFPYEALRAALPSNVFGYYLRASVDFSITSSDHYFPRLAIEVDSDYHDTPAQRQKDAWKDQIFQTCGVPLLRIRPMAPLSDGALRAEVIRALESAEAAVLRMDDKIAHLRERRRGS